MEESSFRAAVVLRRFDAADLDAFFIWASDPRVAAWCRWSAYTSKEDLLYHIQSRILSHPWTRAICLAGSESSPVGRISVVPGVGGDSCRGALSYVLAAEYWGRGIAGAAVKSALRIVFRDLQGMERVEAFVDVENVRSQRVLEKVGFRKDGVLRKYCILKGKTRDMVLYSFLNTDSLED